MRKTKNLKGNGKSAERRWEKMEVNSLLLNNMWTPEKIYNSPVKKARTLIGNHNNNPQFLFSSTDHLITKKLNTSSLLPNYVLCMDFDHFKCKMKSDGIFYLNKF